jgi:outer membrane protein assembly factor BamD
MSERSFFPSLRAGVLAGLAVAGLLVFSISGVAQVTGSSQTTTDANGQQHESVTLSAPEMGKKSKDKKEKEDKVVHSKDTKRELHKTKKTDPLAGVDAKLPDKQLYDKALDATRRGHFDVARLDLQTLLNTYPDSQYQMRAKLAIADSWYKEGGTAALTQAESEYADFRVFFPNAPEAAEAQMRIGDIYFRQMDKPDRDYAKAVHAEEEYRRMLTDYPDSVLVPDARQRLREVQEVMATREAEIGAFYSTHANWPATIARYQTVVDTYPQYSHMDDVLVGLGDAYEAEARYVRTLKLPEAGKARLEKTYDDQAAAAYRKVVLEHAASPHVEDARDLRQSRWKRARHWRTAAGSIVFRIEQRCCCSTSRTWSRLPGQAIRRWWIRRRLLLHR